MVTRQSKGSILIRRMGLFISLMLAALLLGGCGGGGGGGTTVTLQSISITPGDSMIAQGTLKQLTATGTYSDGSTENLTATATWSSSDDSVATVDTQGEANNASATTGSATISAVSGSISGTTTLTATGPLSIKYLVLPSLSLTDASSNPLGATTMPLLGDFDISRQFSTAITGDIAGDQYELALRLMVDGVSEGTLTAQLVVDDGGTETQIFETTIVVDATESTLYNATVVGTDVDTSSGGTLILKLKGDTAGGIIMSSSDTANNAIEMPPIN